MYGTPSPYHAALAPRSGAASLQRAAVATLAAPAVPGTTRLLTAEHPRVLLAQGFVVGCSIRLNPGGANEEMGVIVGFGSLLLKDPLQFPHDQGVTVRVIESQASPGRPEHAC